MTIEIPVWLLWALGIVGGVVALASIVAVGMLAWFGWAMAGVFGKGMRW